MKRINVAMDGTAGVGKSTVADRLAEKYQMTHLDTGAMYRCAALALKKASADLENEKEIAAVIEPMDIEFDDAGNVYLNGEDVSLAIRENDISNYASKTSALKQVREKLVALQQKIAAKKGYIVDGRDICTVVLPDAEVKVYLSAAPEARALRRCRQNEEKGIPADYDAILKDIEARDYQDMNRAISPLIKAEDAVEIDTSNLDIDQVAHQISMLIEQAAQ